MPLSANPAKEKLRKALLMAASDSSQEHEQLIGLLNSKAFLFELQPEQAYYDLAPKRLQVARVIKTLMKSPHAIARETIVRLLKAREFLSLEALQDILIIALVTVRPLPPGAIAFLEQHSTPESAGLHLVLSVLAANESEPALRMFEQKIADSDHEPECRIIWLRVEYLTRRNDVPILHSYRRMIVEGSVPPEMRAYALESLCCYDPAWYLACTKPKPPLRILASSEAKGILRLILAHAKEHMELSPELKMAVETTALAIGDR
jgi:hypothetical protein